MHDGVELDVAGKAEVGHRSDHLLIVVCARILEANAWLSADFVYFGLEIAVEQIGRFARGGTEKLFNRRRQTEFRKCWLQLRLRFIGA